MRSLEIFAKKPSTAMIDAIEKMQGSLSQREIHDALNAVFNKERELVVNVCDSDGNTPLIKATQLGNFHAVQWLLDKSKHPKKDSQPDLTNKLGYCAYEHAVRFEDVPQLEEKEEADYLIGSLKSKRAILAALKNATTLKDNRAFFIYALVYNNQPVLQVQPYSMEYVINEISLAYAFNSAVQLTMERFTDFKKNSRETSYSRKLVEAFSLALQFVRSQKYYTAAQIALMNAVLRHIKYYSIQVKTAPNNTLELSDCQLGKSKEQGIGLLINQESGENGQLFIKEALQKIDEITPHQFSGYAQQEKLLPIYFFDSYNYRPSMLALCKAAATHLKQGDANQLFTISIKNLDEKTDETLSFFSDDLCGKVWRVMMEIISDLVLNEDESILTKLLGIPGFFNRMVGIVADALIRIKNGDCTRAFYFTQVNNPPEKDQEYSKTFHWRGIYYYRYNRNNHNRSREKIVVLLTQFMLRKRIAEIPEYIKCLLRECWEDAALYTLLGEDLNLKQAVLSLVVDEDLLRQSASELTRYLGYIDAHHEVFCKNSKLVNALAKYLFVACSEYDYRIIIKLLPDPDVFVKMGIASLKSSDNFRHPHTFYPFLSRITCEAKDSQEFKEGCRYLGGHLIRHAIMADSDADKAQFEKFFNGLETQVKAGIIHEAFRQKRKPTYLYGLIDAEMLTRQSIQDDLRALVCHVFEEEHHQKLFSLLARFVSIQEVLKQGIASLSNTPTLPNPHKIYPFIAKLTCDSDDTPEFKTGCVVLGNRGLEHLLDEMKQARERESEDKTPMDNRTLALHDERNQFETFFAKLAPAEKVKIIRPFLSLDKPEPAYIISLIDAALLEDQEIQKAIEKLSKSALQNNHAWSAILTLLAPSTVKNILITYIADHLPQQAPLERVKGLMAGANIASFEALYADGEEKENITLIHDFMELCPRTKSIQPDYINIILMLAARYHVRLLTYEVDAQKELLKHIYSRGNVAQFKMFMQLKPHDISKIWQETKMAPDYDEEGLSRIQILLDAIATLEKIELRKTMNDSQKLEEFGKVDARDRSALRAYFMGTQHAPFIQKYLTETSDEEDVVAPKSEPRPQPLAPEEMPVAILVPPCAPLASAELEQPENTEDKIDYFAEGERRCIDVNDLAAILNANNPENDLEPGMEGVPNPSAYPVAAAGNPPPAISSALSQHSLFVFADSRASSPAIEAFLQACHNLSPEECKDPRIVDALKQMEKQSQKLVDRAG